MEEVWKDIPGYEGFYQASTLGRIRSLSRYVAHSSGNGTCYRNGKILQQKSSDQYQSVILSVLGKHKSVGVHRLIAITFIPNPDNLPVVNHKDLNTRNNCVSNLEWVTQRDNCLHAIANGHAANLSPQSRARVIEGSKRASSKPIMCINTNTVYCSVTEASKQLHITHDTIIKSAKHNKPSRSGLQFKYIDKDRFHNTSGSIRIAPECLIR